MHYKNWIAILLIAGIVLGAVGGAIALSLKDHNRDFRQEETPTVPLSEEAKTSMVSLPSISDCAPSETVPSTDRAEAELDVGKIERETNPVVLGGTVEYETKEIPTNEED